MLTMPALQSPSLMRSYFACRVRQPQSGAVEEPIAMAASHSARGSQERKHLALLVGLPLAQTHKSSFGA